MFPSFLPRGPAINRGGCGKCCLDRLLSYSMLSGDMCRPIIFGKPILTLPSKAGKISICISFHVWTSMHEVIHLCYATFILVNGVHATNRAKILDNGYDPSSNSKSPPMFVWPIFTVFTLPEFSLVVRLTYLQNMCMAPSIDQDSADKFNEQLCKRTPCLFKTTAYCHPVMLTVRTERK